MTSNIDFQNDDTSHPILYGAIQRSDIKRFKWIEKKIFTTKKIASEQRRAQNS